MNYPVFRNRSFRALNLTHQLCLPQGASIPKQGHRLVQISGYCVGGEERYAAIWDNGTGPAWQAHTNHANYTGMTISEPFMPDLDLLQRPAPKTKAAV
jgi:hypothetical protein